MAAKYLFITEDGEQIFTVNDEPTAEDLKCHEFGILTIIRLSDLHFLSSDGQWKPVENGVLQRYTKQEAGEERVFHFPEKNPKNEPSTLP